MLHDFLLYTPVDQITRWIRNKNDQSIIDYVSVEKKDLKEIKDCFPFFLEFVSALRIMASLVSSQTNLVFFDIFELHNIRQKNETKNKGYCWEGYNIKVELPEQVRKKNDEQAIVESKEKRNETKTVVGN